MNIKYTCKECRHIFSIDIAPIIPAQTYGPPELCYPAEGGEYEPDMCPQCDAPVDADTVYSMYEETVTDYIADRADMERDIREDR